jgi:methylated-DNA-[protein]-cysteine S-methyltransferase
MLPSVAAAFTICDTPVGPIHVAATGRGIVALNLGIETAEFVDGLAGRLRGAVAPVDDPEVPATCRELLDEACRQVAEYFAGRRRAFDVAIDLRVSDWDRRVLIGAARLAFGETVGYGELARRIGSPGAAQAVGGAMSRNPIGLVIPCHRVIAAGGRIGGYGGGSPSDRRSAIELKRRLLAFEGVEVRD